MTKPFFFVPKLGAIVRDPRTGRAVPATGLSVPNNSYWRRRVKGGDGTVLDPEAGPAKTMEDDTNVNS